jgi:hypothetical protein
MSECEYASEQNSSFHTVCYVHIVSSLDLNLIKLDASRVVDIYVY